MSVHAQSEEPAAQAESAASADKPVRAASAASAAKPVRPLIAGLRERRARHKQRNVIVRVVYVVAAATVVLAGIAMLLLPGPAFVVIPIGLTLLALEFASAERLLDRALDQADAAKAKASATTPAQRLLVVIAGGLAAAAAAAAALVWDIPFLPV